MIIFASWRDFRPQRHITRYQSIQIFISFKHITENILCQVTFSKTIYSVFQRAIYPQCDQTVDQNDQVYIDRTLPETQAYYNRLFVFLRNFLKCLFVFVGMKTDCPPMVCRQISPNPLHLKPNKTPPPKKKP